MDALAETIKLAALFNSGQDCTAATRIIVMGDGYDRALEALVPAVESIKVGDPASDPELDMWTDGQQIAAGSRGGIHRPCPWIRRRDRGWR